MLAVVYSRIPFRRSVEMRSRSSERRWSVMSMPVLMTCVISPSVPTRQVLAQEISRRSLLAVIHSRSVVAGNCSGRNAASSRRTACAVSGGARISQVRRPIMSWAERPVTRSHARLKVMMVPEPSSTRMSDPAVSMPVAMTSRSAFSAAWERTRSLMSVAMPRKPVSAPSASRWTVTVIETRIRSPSLRT